MPQVYVSVGSNVEREHNIRAAVHALRKNFNNVETSPVYECKAEGFDGDDFYNLVVRFDTDDSLERLCDRLAQIEAAQGRVRTDARYAPRTLDIDVLLYGDIVRHDDRFDIPRRDIVVYAHVLGPLLALAPNLRHPETGEQLADRWRQFDEKAGLHVVTLDFNAAPTTDVRSAR
jgi:2-amino-4-hydroxy-6-hydroxymethyldihydropteridine diphosphokinase